MSEVDATHRMEQHRSTRCRLLSGFSGLARSRAMLTADTPHPASLRTTETCRKRSWTGPSCIADRVHPHQATDRASKRGGRRRHSQLAIHMREGGGAARVTPLCGEEEERSGKKNPWGEAIGRCSYITHKDIKLPIVRTWRTRIANYWIIFREMGNYWRCSWSRAFVFILQLYYWKLVILIQLIIKH